MLGCLGCISWVLSTPPYDARRFKVLIGAAALEGATIGPLIDMAIRFDPSILVIAIVGCAIAFGCFSAAAIYARSREFLYMGGILSSAVSILLWMSIASSLFGGSTKVFKFELYVGLLVFVGYIVFDTQNIIDYVKHAMTLFTDFIARVLIIILKNSAEKEVRKRKKKT